MAALSPHNVYRLSSARRIGKGVRTRQRRVLDDRRLRHDHERFPILKALVPASVGRLVILGLWKG